MAHRKNVRVNAVRHSLARREWARRSLLSVRHSIKRRLRTWFTTYYRHTDTDLENDAVFVMTPGNSAGKVTVWFNRKLLLTDKGGLQ